MDQKVPVDQKMQDEVDPEAALTALAAIDRLSPILKRQVEAPSREVRDALHKIASAFGFEIVEECDPWEDEDEDAPPSLDAHEIDEARARAMRGEIEDAVIHLGRALPADFTVIADRIGDHLRRAR